MDTTTTNSNEPTPMQDQTDGDHAHQEDGVENDLGDFIQHLENYNPAIPDVVVHHYLNLKTNDKRVARLIATAAQKFIADIVSDSLQHCKLRDQTKKKDKRYVLTKEDLSAALAEHGISIRRPDYFN